MKWLFATVLFLCVVSVSAFDLQKWAMAELNSPQQKAETDYREQRIGLVGLLTEKGREVPGIEEAGNRNLPVRYLNQYWQAHTPIEQHAPVLLQTRAYALRYNLKMIQLLKKQEYEDRMKYRY